VIATHGCSSAPGDASTGPSRAFPSPWGRVAAAGGMARTSPGQRHEFAIYYIKYI
jgi:hypothetical protein